MLPCFLQEGEPITPTGEPLNENLEPLKQDDVDTSNRPGQNPDSVVDKIPNSTVTQSEWHGRHTEEEMDVIINSNTPEKTYIVRSILSSSCEGDLERGTETIGYEIHE